MGKEVRGLSEAPALSATGVGHYLASQRRLRGISLDELAGLTKIPRRSLERLESGAFDTSSDGFVRGFVRAVAVSLGLDPDEAVMRLMAEPEEQAERDAAVGDSFGAHVRRWLPGLLALLAAALLCLGLWFLVSGWLTRESPDSADDVILRRDPVRSLAGEAERPAPGAPPPASP